MLKSSDIRALSVDEMEERLFNFKKELLNMRIELKLGKLEKHHKIGVLKRDIARLLTIIREEKSKETDAAKGAKG